MNNNDFDAVTEMEGISTKFEKHLIGTVEKTIELGNLKMMKEITKEITFLQTQVTKNTDANLYTDSKVVKMFKKLDIISDKLLDIPEKIKGMEANLIRLEGEFKIVKASVDNKINVGSVYKILSFVGGGLTLIFIAVQSISAIYSANK